MLNFTGKMQILRPLGFSIPSTNHAYETGLVIYLHLRSESLLSCVVVLIHEQNQKCSYLELWLKNCEQYTYEGKKDGANTVYSLNYIYM